MDVLSAVNGTFAGMRPATSKKIWTSGLVLIICFLLLGVIRNFAVSTATTDGFSPEKVNLALRRTAHHLLAESGDSTSRIPAVQQTDDYVWQIRLEHPFSYDRLPVLLQESMKVQDLGMDYNVALLRCIDGELELGYSNKDYVETNNPTCGGRTMGIDVGIEMGCYQLQVSFSGMVTAKSRFPALIWLFFGAVVLAGVFYWLGRQWRPKKFLKQEQGIDAGPVNGIRFGNSRLDAVNQLLWCGNATHKLTYREAKLLHLFVARPNQLLERDFILQQVWADEGILVGRSIDVFVSRLRKMLRDDPDVGMVAVHGVGYRLEVKVPGFEVSPLKSETNN